MKKTIMVVDDDPSINYTIKQGMKELNSNYEIITIESGKKCLELLEDNLIPDLIILDILMPEISGWETYNIIKEKPIWNNIPIIFISGRIDKKIKNIGGFLGDAYIEKPFKISDLKNCVDRILKKSN